jgi:hypothetical protein
MPLAAYRHSITIRTREATERSNWFWRVVTEEIRETIPRQSSEHPICDALRKDVRPLVHGLGRDADRLCRRGGCPAQQRNGF